MVSRVLYWWRRGSELTLGFGILELNAGQNSDSVIQRGLVRISEQMRGLRMGVRFELVLQTAAEPSSFDELGLPSDRPRGVAF